MQAQPIEWYKQSVQQVCTVLQTDASKGLPQESVLERRQKYGLNEIKNKKKINPLIILIRQFKSFIIYILIFALIISLFAREYTDAITIFIILVLNAFIGFFQEYRAEKAIESLKRLVEVKAKVLRAGIIQLINSKELVPGDIILLEEGSKIPADARIIESVEMRAAEASLTGESSSVSKKTEAIVETVSIGDQENLLFSGTSIVSGRGKAIIINTGMQTEIGKIARLIEEVKEEATPLQQQLESFGKKLSIAILAICFIILLIGIFKEGDFSLLIQGNIVEFLFAIKTWLLISVSLAVAAVPEGLPAIVTISLAMGVVKMMKRNALMRKLPSVETLGETSVICTDKTGTLTKNEMTVRIFYTNKKEFSVTGEGYSAQGDIKSANGSFVENDKTILRIGALCNNASLNITENNIEIIGDPTEAAFLVVAEKAGISHKKLSQEWLRVKEIPFSSERKMMSTINKNPKNKKEYVFTKGAAERVLDKCSFILLNGRVMRLRSSDKLAILEKNENLAKQALRVLGFAYKEYNPREEAEERLIFAGLQAMIDPPRHEVPEAIQKCKQAGIRVIMITGDHLKTAQAIAKEIGLEGNALEGKDFAALTEEEQFKIIESTSIFARVEPQHKMLMVGILQRQGEIVAMTGDGVNDAPALKKSNIGIAMGITGTDVAKDASDMVLQDDNFASIVNAVEEGRGIYENIRKFINYLLSSNMAEIAIIVFALIFGWPLPMTAVMLLWLNLVTDGLPALALSIDPVSAGIMQRPPKKASEGILNKNMAFNILYVSFLITLGVLSVFYIGINIYSQEENSFFLQKIQTLAFTALVVMELVRIQAIRSEYRLGMFSNKYLVLAVIASLVLQLAVIYTPLNIFFKTVYLNVVDWIIIAGASMTVLILNKVGVFMYKKRGQHR